MKSKPCKGTGKAKGYGCGTESIKRTYGLCIKCLREWAVGSEEGKQWLSKQTAYKMRSNEKEKKKEFREKKQELNVKCSMRNADTYFSRYVRLINSIDGNCTCYTCGGINDIKETDNGHYMKREHKATRYHENNCRPQCKTCNGDTKHNGKQAEFRVHLANEIGEENVVKIENLSRTLIKANHLFYKEKSDYYRIKVNELQKELGVKYW